MSIPKNLPIGEYEVIEVKDAEGTATVGSNVQPDANLGEMSFIYELSRTSDKAEVTSSKAGQTELVNKYTSGQYCIAVTKQWMVNGEPYAADGLSLNVTLQRSTDGTNWTDVIGYSNKPLNKDNNWSTVATGMDQMDPSGTRYHYKWIETVPDGWAEGAQTEVLKNPAINTQVYLTMLTNSRVNVEIPVQKEIIGDDYHGDEQFEVKLINFSEKIGNDLISPTGVTYQANGQTTELNAAEIKLRKDEKGTFSIIGLSKAGTYTAVIKETGKDTAGMTYDENEKIVTFEVEWAKMEGQTKDMYLHVKEETFKWEDRPAGTTTGTDRGEISANNPVKVTNKYERGKLIITKTFNFGTDPEATDFDKSKLTFEITGPSGFKPVTVNLRNFTRDEGTGIYSYELENLVLGEYTVTESGANGLIDHYTLAANKSTTSPISVALSKDDGNSTNGKETEQTVEFTNTYTQDKGKVQVKKTVSGHELPEGFQITNSFNDAVFTVSNKTRGTGTADDPYIWEIENVPVGTAVTFTESGADVRYYTLESVKKDSDATDFEPGTSATATVTEKVGTAIAELKNVYTPMPGSLTITKQVNSDAAEDSERKFHFTVKLERDGADFAGTLTGIEFKNGTAQLYLQDGESVTIRDIPVGTEYTVTEDADSLFTTNVDNGTKEKHVISGTIEQNEEGKTISVSHTFTNTRLTGELQISKTVVDAISEREAAKDFEFTVKLAQKVSVTAEFETKKKGKDGEAGAKIRFTDGDTYTVKLKGGDVLRILGLPQGIGYTVTETKDEDFDTLLRGTAGTIGEDAAKAEFINIRKTVLTDIPVTKIWDDGSDSFGLRPAFIVIHLDQKVGDTVRKDYQIAVITAQEADGEDSWKHVFTNLPVYEHGNEITYSIREEVPEGYSAAYAPESAEIIPATANARALAAGLQVTNSLKRGNLVVTKQVTGVTGQENREFKVTVRNGNGLYLQADGTSFGPETAEFTVTERKPLKLNRIPIGLYTVEETATGRNLVPDCSWNEEGSTANAEAELEENATTTAALINDYRKMMGRISVTKLVKDEYGDAIATDNTCTFVITNKKDETLTETLTVAAGETAETGDLPLGIYTVTETGSGEIDEYSYTETRLNGKKGMTAEVTVEANTTVAVTAENIYTGNPGSLTVDKSIFIDNTRSGDNDGVTFYVKVSGVIHGETWYVTSENGALDRTNDRKVFAITAGKPITFTGLPAGTYTVTETNAAGQPISAENAAAAIGDTAYVFDLSRTAETALVARGGSAEAHIVNKYTSGAFCLAVTKAWNDDRNADGSRPAELKVELQRKTAADTEWTTVKGIGNVKAEDDFITLNETNNWSATAIGQPKHDANGNEYSYRWVEKMTETDLQNYAEGAQAELQHSADGKRIYVTRLNNTRARAEIPVRKVLNGGAYTGEERFEIRITRTGAAIEGDRSEILNDTVRLAPGEEGSFLITGYTVPGTYTYEVKETAGTIPGMTYDTRAYPVTVEVAWNESRTALTAEASAAKAPVTVTNEYQTAELTVSKKVVSDAAADKDEAFLFTIRLSEPITGEFSGVKIQKGTAQIWLKDGESITLKGLPYGTEYSVAETAPERYTKTVEGEKSGKLMSRTAVTYTNTAEYTEKTVKKVWKDSENSHGRRPKQITAALKADGEVVKAVILNEENGWTWTETGLPISKAGREILYTWEETDIPAGYEMEKATEGNLTTITNIYRTGRLKITKTFSDNVAKNPAVKDLTFTIVGPSFRKTLAYSEFENGERILEDLIPGTYAVTENNAYGLIKGYVLKVADSVISASCIVSADNDLTINLKNVYEEEKVTPPSPGPGPGPGPGPKPGPTTGTIVISKTFTGMTDLDEPGNLTFRILGPDGYDRRITYSEFTDGLYTIENLTPGQYLVYEMNAAVLNTNWKLLGTSVTTAGGALAAGETVTFELQNDYEVPTTSVGIMKVWDDRDNLDGSRPASLQVTLMRGAREVRTVTLNEGNEWKAEITGLPLFNAGGEVIRYSWSEQEVPGYALTSQVKLGNATVLKNTHRPEMTTASVTKIWDDNNNEAGLRPASLRVRLSNGSTYILNEANHWSVTVENLPKYVDGEEVKYTWNEQSVLGYTQTDVRTVGNTTVFTNSYRTALPPTPDGKPPKGGHLVKIEDYATPLGIEILINHVGDCYE